MMVLSLTFYKIILFVSQFKVGEPENGELVLSLGMRIPLLQPSSFLETNNGA